MGKPNLNVVNNDCKHKLYVIINGTSIAPNTFKIRGN